MGVLKKTIFDIGNYYIGIGPIGIGKCLFLSDHPSPAASRWISI